MNITVKIDLPAGLKLTAAQEYVGGRTAFEKLALRYPSILVPFIQEPKLTVYRRETLDQVVKIAEEEARRNEN